jgi:hypothetical protein
MTSLEVTKNKGSKIISSFQNVKQNTNTCKPMRLGQFHIPLQEKRMSRGIPPAPQRQSNQ